jgi:hypothetical protein
LSKSGEAGCTFRIFSISLLVPGLFNSFSTLYLCMLIIFSTGGIIALGLGARNWSVDECISYFQKLCMQAFTPRAGINIPGMSPIIESIHHSKYETRPLQEALQEAFTNNTYLFGGAGNLNSRTKVAVTATTSGSTSVLANYNRCCSGKRKLRNSHPL